MIELLQIDVEMLQSMAKKECTHVDVLTVKHSTKSSGDSGVLARAVEAVSMAFRRWPGAPTRLTVVLVQGNRLSSSGFGRLLWLGSGGRLYAALFAFLSSVFGRSYSSIKNNGRGGRLGVAHTMRGNRDRILYALSIISAPVRRSEIDALTPVLVEARGSVLKQGSAVSRRRSVKS